MKISYQKLIVTASFCFHLFHSNAFAQTYLIEQGNNESLMIVDVATNKYEVLSNAAFGIFAGYEIKDDSLICYFNKRGKLSTMNFRLSEQIIVPDMPRKLSPDFDSCHLNTRIHKYKNYTLMIGSGAVLYQNGQIIWSADCENPQFYLTDTTKSYFLSGYMTPQISPDETSIVFEVRRTAIWTPGQWIIEIDFKTGEKIKIGNGTNPCYSPDGRYILYKDDQYNYYYVYDKSTRKQRKICENGVGFWLYN